MNTPVPTILSVISRTYTCILEETLLILVNPESYWENCHHSADPRSTVNILETDWDGAQMILE